MIYLKLATIPGQSPTLKADIAASITPPGNMKKPETIAAWMRDEKPAAVEERWLKTALDGASGEIVAIAWAVDGLEPQCLTVGDGVRIRPGVSPFEGTLIREALASIAEARLRQGLEQQAAPTWIGHSIRDFHLRFLWQRCVVRGIKPPFALPHNVRPDDPRVIDLQYLWGGWDGRASLDAISGALGMTKGLADGADTWKMVSAGRMNELADALRYDVDRIRSAYQRLTFAEVGSGAQEAAA